MSKCSLLRIVLYFLSVASLGYRCTADSATVSVLALNTTVRVFFAVYPRGTLERGDRLVIEGIAQHPFAEVVDDPDSADFILCFIWSVHMTLSTRFDNCRKYEETRRLVLVDFQDGHGIVTFRHPVAYFKRSCVARADGISSDLIDAVRDMQSRVVCIKYGVQTIQLNAGLADPVDYHSRAINALCTIRPVPGPHRRAQSKVPKAARSQYFQQRMAFKLKHSSDGGSRARVRQWLVDLSSNPEYPNIVVQEFNASEYLRSIRNAKIVVSADPSQMEGSLRTFETLASGALLFQDDQLSPQLPILRNGIHAVYFNGSNSSDFTSKFDYYMKHPEISAAIAHAGKMLALKFHRSLNRADFVLWTALCFNRTGDKQGCLKYPVPDFRATDVDWDRYTTPINPSFNQTHWWGRFKGPTGCDLAMTGRVQFKKWTSREFSHNPPK